MKRLMSVALTVVSGSVIVWGAACSSDNSSNPPPDGGTSTSSSSSSSSSTSSTSSSSSSSSSSSGGVDAGFKTPCKADATGTTLIDDESISTGTQIKLAATFSPSGCGSAGTWFDYPAGMITPSPFMFSAQPPGLGSDGGGAPEAGGEAGPTDSGSPLDAAIPVDGRAPDAAVLDAASGDSAASDTGTGAGGDGAISGARAACINGTTGATQYSTSGIGLNFNTSQPTDGGNAIPVPTDAHTHTGIQFWVWGGETTAQSVLVTLPDINETPGLGPPGTLTATGQLCDPGTNGVGSGGSACGGSRVSATIQPGWQLVQLPFANFAPVQGFGTSNENTLDPSTLTQFQLQVQEPNADAGAGVPFNICIATISFY